MKDITYNRKEAEKMKNTLEKIREIFTTNSRFTKRAIERNATIEWLDKKAKKPSINQGTKMNAMYGYIETLRKRKNILEDLLTEESNEDRKVIVLAKKEYKALQKELIEILQEYIKLI